MFVLFPKFQQRQKLPRLEACSKKRMFMGFIQVHANDVALVLNLHTGAINPRFHVGFDDLFNHSLDWWRERKC